MMDDGSGLESPKYATKETTPFEFNDRSDLHTLAGAPLA